MELDRKKKGLSTVILVSLKVQCNLVCKLEDKSGKSTEVKFERGYKV